MKTEKGPFDVKTYFSGANYSDEKEFAGGSAQDGDYIDSRNGRHTSVRSNKKAHEKIHGEVVLYPKTLNIFTYGCVGAVSVNGHIFEVWADKNGLQDSIIRIDGQVVLKSDKFPAVIDYPFQIVKNENSLGGEVMMTDYNSLPMIFNVQSLIDASDPSSPAYDPNLYFSNFNLSVYTTSLKTTLDHPAFIQLEFLGGGGGVPPGKYAYSYRYATAQGDRTKFSPDTPLVPVPENAGSATSIHPWVKTYGANPSPGSKTSYGVKIKYRVNNAYDYEFVEIRRVAYNTGAALGFVPQAEIIAKIPIGPGEVSVREFIDGKDNDANSIPISDADDTMVLSEVQSAKAIRYFNRRLVLMGIRYASRNIDNIQMLKVGGKSAFPIVEKLSISGHSDIYHNTYNQSLMSGERYGWAIVGIDGNGETSFARPMTASEIADIYQVPNRRDPLSADSIDFCVTRGKGAPVAADVNNLQNYVHEVFDLGAAISKTSDSAKNISAEGSKDGTDSSDIGYKPLRPAGDTDSTTDGHDFRVNVNVRDGGSAQSYNPKGFSLNYYAKGVAFRGVDTSTLPSWIKAFSIARTEPAGRVICQGIGVYRMTEADRTQIGVGFSTGITKDKNKLVFYSPDIEAGIVSSDIINDISSNPGRYSVQLVSPLGYFSEVYGGDIFTAGFDRGIDLITYARCLYNDSQTNPGIVNGYTKFGSWRNTISPTNPVVANGGNYKVGISNITSVEEGRQTYYELLLSQNIYDNSSQGGGTGTVNGWEFDDLNEFHEPFYIVNIIQDGAQVKDSNINEYVYTGHYQKLESLIGVSSGISGQLFELVDERFDDCIPNQYDPGKPNINTYLFIDDGNGNAKRWLNVTYKTNADLLVILNSLQANGVYNDGVNDIFGVYKSTNSLDRFYAIDFTYFNTSFDEAYFVPPINHRVLVRYDNRFPIKVFGGDVSVGEDVFALIDRNSGATGNKDHEFLMASGFPFRKYEFNGNYYVVRKGNGSIDIMQGEENIKLDYIRQLCIMFTCESRISLPFQFGDHFAAKNYVMRPYIFDTTENNNFKDAGGNIYEEYRDDYPGEFNNWGYGGFKFFKQTNIDYSAVLNDRKFVSKPKVGFKEQTEFGSRVIWSVKRDINVQDAPGLRTFPSTNAFDISDSQGGIKFAYDANSSKGPNLYAITNNGVCLLLTDKTILSDLSGGELGYMAADGFILGEYWLRKDVGMWDEMWRSAAEASVPAGPDSKELIDALMWANNESVYALMNNSVIDIGEIKYHSKIYPEALKNIQPGYGTHITGAYDRQHKEYWLHIRLSPTFAKTYVFSAEKFRWTGYFDYSFDRFVSRNFRTFGMKDEETWELNIGDNINGAPIVYEVLQASAPETDPGRQGVEFQRIHMDTSSKPSRIEFYKEVDGVMQCAVDQSIQGPLYVKNYDGHECDIPRIDATVSPDRHRLQGRLMIYKIIHSQPGDFRIIKSIVRYKVLK